MNTTASEVSYHNMTFCYRLYLCYFFKYWLMNILVFIIGRLHFLPAYNALVGGAFVLARDIIFLFSHNVLVWTNIVKFKLYLFYNDYETSYTTTYINHARRHRCLLSDGLCVGGNRSTWRKPTCLTWPSHMPTPGIEPGSQRWEASASTHAIQLCNV